MLKVFVAIGRDRACRRKYQGRHASQTRLLNATHCKRKHIVLWRPCSTDDRAPVMTIPIGSNTMSRDKLPINYPFAVQVYTTTTSSTLYSLITLNSSSGPSQRVYLSLINFSPSDFLLFKIRRASLTHCTSKRSVVCPGWNLISIVDRFLKESAKSPMKPYVGVLGVLVWD